MVVIVLSLVPESLRGVLTRWLLEIATGVYVGVLPARVRDEVWKRISTTSGTGRAIMIYGTRGEQRLAFRVHNHKWLVENFDGLELMRIPVENSSIETQVQPKAPRGWSHASHRKRRE